MNSKTSTSREDAIKANIYVHSSIVSQYENEPHFRPENQIKVKERLLELMERLPEKSHSRLLDFGCGTGFIINLIKDHFERIDGVDVTQAMLDRIDTSSGNIFLHQGPAESTPFEDSVFDMASAYSFMDHLADYKELLLEAHRVLKPGGILYIDLNPNQKYWLALEQLDKQPDGLHPFVMDEIYAAIHNDERVSKQYNIDKNTLVMAEPAKTQAFGFDADEVLSAAREIGYSNVYAHYHWYLAQAKVMHQQSFEVADYIDEHLRRLSPLTDHLYKYLEFTFVK